MKSITFTVGVCDEGGYVAHLAPFAPALEEAVPSKATSDLKELQQWVNDKLRALGGAEMVQPRGTSPHDEDNGTIDIARRLAVTPRTGSITGRVKSAFGG